MRNRKRVLVKVPAGVDSGTRLRLRGEGESGYRGGPPGDLYVRIEVTPHPHIERDGDNLHMKISISFMQAIIGDTCRGTHFEWGKIHPYCARNPARGCCAFPRGRGPQIEGIRPR